MTILWDKESNIFGRRSICNLRRSLRVEDQYKDKGISLKNISDRDSNTIVVN